MRHPDKNVTVLIQDSPEQLAKEVANRFLAATIASLRRGAPFFAALSGGATPRILFKELSSESLRSQIPWKIVHLFWGDERCVPPDDPSSNFGTAKAKLLSRISIPDSNIHRIHGEARPHDEAVRYSEEVNSFVARSDNGLPRFDWIFLGLGVDGHVASLFPDSPATEESRKLCFNVTHPVTGQNRITLSLPVINNVLRIVFMVTGSDKAAIVREVVGGNSPGKYPASRVFPLNGRLEWHLDKAAAANLTDEIRRVR